MACGVRGPFSEFLGCIRSEIAIFLRFLRAGPVTLPCELDSRASPTTLPCELAQVRWSFPVLVTEKSYMCTTKREELKWVLPIWGIKLSNFEYEFFFSEGSHRLYETTRDSFLFSLYALEASFHLPLHLFFCSLLNDYNITPDQLLGFSWWLAMI
ncbi:hypothetical protein PVK06_002391 [Gossypium arboreum]|uniref:Uncharacterized protein n=1 Tax=Gossypium arboreum TaxID=29729 RepID=A0ABR0R3H0_GOSAR|nr:hypothetical protein PVK06_002391 [Gossypium arboreum]